MRHVFRQRWWVAAIASFAIFVAFSSPAQTIDPAYASTYSVSDLGSAPGVPFNYGGLTFKAGDPNTLLLGGAAAAQGAKIYSVPLTRDPTTHHVTAFGSATVFATADGVTGGIDGGMSYGPGGVLFYTTYSDAQLGQIKPGSAGPDKLVALSGAGLAPSTGSLVFVPAGFAGAGRLKINSYDGGNWYDTTLTPDGSGTYNVNPVGPAINIGGGPEGTIYISHTSPLFPNDSVLVNEYDNDLIVAYDINANGDPILATKRNFMTGLVGPEGSVIDPLTGDFLFSTNGNPAGDHIVRVQVPEPSSSLLLLILGWVTGVVRPRRRVQG